MRKTRQIRPWNTTLGFAVFFAVTHQDLPACSTSTNGADEVSAHFSVSVVTYGRPVTGLRIELRILTGNPLSDQVHPVMAPLKDAELTLLQAVAGEIAGEQVASPSRRLKPGLRATRAARLKARPFKAHRKRIQSSASRQGCTVKAVPARREGRCRFEGARLKARR